MGGVFIWGSGVTFPKRNLTPNKKCPHFTRLSYATRVRLHLLQKQAAGIAQAENWDERQREMRAEALRRHAARIYHESGGQWGYL